jgi:uncharacterized alpha-E superfamily protein
MLSRTAEALFWLGRYSERAGNVARGLQVALRMATMTGPLGAAGDEWRGLLIATGGDVGFYKDHTTATQDAVVQYLASDPANPSSILSCVEAARRNARAVRTALTVDMWEAINDTWIELRRQGPAAPRGQALVEHLDWVKSRALLFNGASADTMMRTDSWRFVRLGTMLERADNTARILDVKHHVLARAEDGPSGAVDYVQWQAILRSVSALRAYHWIYHTRLQPHLIAELMILREELPRSILACHRQVAQTLEDIAASNGDRRGRCHEIALALHAELRTARISDILAGGLHGFLTRMIDRNLELGAAIGEFYLNLAPPAAAPAP